VCGPSICLKISNKETLSYFLRGNIRNIPSTNWVVLGPFLFNNKYDMAKEQINAIKLAKLKIQIDIVRKCIYMSQNIIASNGFKLSLDQNIFFLSRLSYVIPHAIDYIKSMRESNDVLMYDLKRQIATSLRNLMQMSDKDLYIGNLFWFSMHDIKYGYVLLYPSSYTGLAKYVLFLREVKDHFDGTIYFPGDIRLFKQVNHVLNSIPKLSNKELRKSLPFHIIHQHEILQELVQLKQSLKHT
jgi:hypothetical protein